MGKVNIITDESTSSIKQQFLVGLGKCALCISILGCPETRVDV